MTTGDLEDYEHRVAGATRLLGEFTSQLANELDEQNGGFRWWQDFTDWKTITMLSDYLSTAITQRYIGGADVGILASRSASAGQLRRR